MNNNNNNGPPNMPQDQEFMRLLQEAWQQSMLNDSNNALKEKEQRKNQIQLQFPQTKIDEKSDEFKLNQLAEQFIMEKESNKTKPGQVQTQILKNSLKCYDQKVGGKLGELQKYGMTAQKSVCGKILTQKDTGVKCLDCEMDPTCIICKECFEKGNHQGHRVIVQSAVSGCCDCGDQDAWKVSGFCCDHQGSKALENLSTDCIPGDIKKSIFSTLGQCFFYMFSICEDIWVQNEGGIMEIARISEYLELVLNAITLLKGKNVVLDLLVYQFFMTPLSDYYNFSQLLHDCDCLQEFNLVKKFKSKDQLEEEENLLKFDQSNQNSSGKEEELQIQGKQIEIKDQESPQKTNSGKEVLIEKSVCKCTILENIFRFNMFLDKKSQQKLVEFFIGLFNIIDFQKQLILTYIKMHRFLYWQSLNPTEEVDVNEIFIFSELQSIDVQLFTSEELCKIAGENKNFLNLPRAVVSLINRYVANNYRCSNFLTNFYQCFSEISNSVYKAGGIKILILNTDFFQALMDIEFELMYILSTNVAVDIDIAEDQLYLIEVELMVNKVLKQLIKQLIGEKEFSKEQKSEILSRWILIVFERLESWSQIISGTPIKEANDERKLGEDDNGEEDLPLLKKQGSNDKQKEPSFFDSFKNKLSQFTGQQSKSKSISPQQQLSEIQSNYRKKRSINTPLCRVLGMLLFAWFQLDVDALFSNSNRALQLCEYLKLKPRQVLKYLHFACFQTFQVFGHVIQIQLKQRLRFTTLDSLSQLYRTSKHRLVYLDVSLVQISMLLTQPLSQDSTEQRIVMDNFFFGCLKSFDPLSPFWNSLTNISNPMFKKLKDQNENLLHFNNFSQFIEVMNWIANDEISLVNLALYISGSKNGVVNTQLTNRVTNFLINYLHPQKNIQIQQIKQTLQEKFLEEEVSLQQLLNTLCNYDKTQQVFNLQTSYEHSYFDPIAFYQVTNFHSDFSQQINQKYKAVEQSERHVLLLGKRGDTYINSHFRKSMVNFVYSSTFFAYYAKFVSSKLYMRTFPQKLKAKLIRFHSNFKRAIFQSICYFLQSRVNNEQSVISITSILDKVQDEKDTEEVLASFEFLQETLEKHFKGVSLEALEIKRQKSNDLQMNQEMDQVKRKELKQQKQQQIMEMFKKKQQNFAIKNMSEVSQLDKESEVLEEKQSQINENDIEVCIFCQEELNTENITGLSLYATKSNIPFIVDYQRHLHMEETEDRIPEEYANLSDISHKQWQIKTVGGFVYSTCNHQMHYKCFKKSREKQNKKYEEAQDSAQMVEIQCPLCHHPANFFLPEFQSIFQVAFPQIDRGQIQQYSKQSLKRQKKSVKTATEEDQKTDNTNALQEEDTHSDSPSPQKGSKSPIFNVPPLQNIEEFFQNDDQYGKLGVIYKQIQISDFASTLVPSGRKPTAKQLQEDQDLGQKIDETANSLIALNFLFANQKDDEIDEVNQLLQSEAEIIDYLLKSTIDDNSEGVNKEEFLNKLDGVTTNMFKGQNGNAESGVFSEEAVTSQLQKQDQILQIFENSILASILRIDQTGLEYFLQKNMQIVQSVVLNYTLFISQFQSENKHSFLCNQKLYIQATIRKIVDGRARVQFPAYVYAVNERDSNYLENNLEYLMVKTLLYHLLYFDLDQVQSQRFCHDLFQSIFLGLLVQRRIQKEGQLDQKLLQIDWPSIIPETLNNQDEMEFYLPFARQFASIMLITHNYEENTFNFLESKVYDSAIQEFDDLLKISLLSQSIISQKMQEDVGQVKLWLNVVLSSRQKIQTETSAEIQQDEQPSDEDGLLPYQIMQLNPNRGLRLVPLEENFSDMVSEYSGQTCGICQDFAQNWDMCLCLICGMVLCSISCKQKNKSIEAHSGNLSDHSAAYHCGSCVFMSLKTSKLVYIQCPMNTIMNDLYVDQYDQPVNLKSQDWSRYKLNKELYNKINELLSRDDLVSEIYRSNNSQKYILNVF